MAGLKTVIYTNGVVVSTYDNGTPADMFTGKLPVLHNIFKYIDSQYRDTLPREYRIMTVNFYIADDPLCKSHIEVNKSYLEHILKFVKHEKLENFPIETKTDVDVNKLIEEGNKQSIQENINFDNEIPNNQLS